MDETLEHTVLNTKFTELQEACRRGDVAVPSFTTAPCAGEVLSNDVSRLAAAVSKLQVKHDGLAAQLSTVTLEFGTWRSLVRERGNDIINLRALLDTLTD